MQELDVTGRQPGAPEPGPVAADIDSIDGINDIDAPPAPSVGRAGARLLKVLSIIALASAALFFIQRNTDSEVRTYSIAPEVEFTTYDGETVRLSDLQGQGVVLNFWGSWCGPCRAEAPWLAEAWAREEGNGIVFIGLTHQDTEQGARAMMAEFGLTYPNGPDIGNTWSRRYDVQGIPATFFIDADGMLVSQQRGMLFSAEDLAQRLDEIRP